ncbi:hypothetical protein [Streptomyces sp. TR02-1]|uniref:hypothetical protein n=1 Tax=Streptomyces sp. TR02-1 TaxID=3385977 RepID=UPI00399F7A80
MNDDHQPAGGSDSSVTGITADVSSILEGEMETDPPVALSSALVVRQVPHHIELWHDLPGVLRLSLGGAASELLAAELAPQELRIPGVLEVLHRSGVEARQVPSGDGMRLEMSFAAAALLAVLLEGEDEEPPPGPAAIGA